MFLKKITAAMILPAIIGLGCLTLISCTTIRREPQRLTEQTIRPSERTEETQAQSRSAEAAPSVDQNTDSQPKGNAEQPLQLANLSQEPKASDVSGNKPAPPQPAEKTDPPRRAIVSSDLSGKNGASAKQPIKNSFAANPPDEQRNRKGDNERDIMEEALLLLDESQKYWANGELEDAIQLLDQAYALLLETNGDPDIARQKDDLRLMISKRILSIYNSNQPVAKGKRSEIPIVTNPDIEKEIRLFQTVERDFFVSSYQRSMIYRPVILRELKKAGLPEELSWLPLVESGYKISALSSARALGLWQFIPSTGYKYGLNRSDWIDERMDVEKSTRAAIDYMKDLHAMFGDWLTVLAGYNCGEGRIMRTIASQHINYLDRFWDLYSRLPNETARYVPRFLATLLIVKDPQKYGIDLGSGELRPDILTYEEAEIDRSLRLQDIAQKLEVSEETIYILNAELRHRTTPDRPYKIKVPVGKAALLVKVAADMPSAERPRALLAGRGVFIKHKVRKGETVASIADKYKTSIDAIRSANPSAKKRLVVGQRLNIPIRVAKASGSPVKEERAGRPANYKIQKGDTLASVSRKYGVSVPELRKMNDLKGDSLKIGQTLQLSKKKEEAPQPGETKKTAKNNPDSTEQKRYTVKKGDTLNKIARENSVSLDKLLKLNQMGQKSVLRPGQVIVVQ